MLFGDDKVAHAKRLYKQAAQSVAADAMERLDIELAQALLPA